jgi:fructose-1,6-bisphosphatase/inositol monophosphatase family enzyme
MEEAGAVAGRDGEHRWLVDPIDGTTNFIHGIPHFAISIALERSGTDHRRGDLQSDQQRPVHRRARARRLSQRPPAQGRGQARAAAMR